MPIAADRTSLQRLLELQQQETSIDRARKRLRELPEATRLAELERQLRELTSDIEVATRNRDEVVREQDRMEGEIELSEQKLQREERRLFSGSVSNPKELSALQAEVEMLKRRRAALEDELLEAMVARDGAMSTLQSLSAERDQIARETEDLRAVVSALTGEIRAELEAKEKDREGLRASLPADLVKLYDGLRAAKGGVGAAPLDRDTCQGCHTKLPAREVERLRAEGGLQRCENCRRILVVS